MTYHEESCQPHAAGYACVFQKAARRRVDVDGHQRRHIDHPGNASGRCVADCRLPGRSRQRDERSKPNGHQE
jgi:hypothetical protein